MAGFLPPGSTSSGGASGFLPADGSPVGFLPTHSLAAMSPVGLGQAGTLQSTVLRYHESSLGQFMANKEREQLVAAGFTPSTDPSVLDLQTPESQRAANEAALAKIATANPELAEELSARLTGETEDKGFFDQLKDFAGDLLHPVISIGAKALDIISRPAQIIPELIVDKEDDPWYEDIGQALSGNSTARGADVMEKWGVENGFLRGLGGFAFDVAADPLTWTTFGLSGVGRQVAASAAGRAVAEDVVFTGLRHTGDDVARKYAAEVAERMTSLAKVSDDALPGMVADSISNVPRELVEDAVSRANEFTLAVQRGSKLSKSVNPEDLATVQALGVGTGRNARALAGGTGGMRIRAGVPFTSLRWTSGALMGTQNVMAGRVFSNFFRGTSGVTRLKSFISQNPQYADLGTGALNTFIEKGFSGLVKDPRYAALAKHLSGGPLHLGSRYWEASHLIGKVTGYMSPHSYLYRNGGLAGIAAIDAGRYAKSLESQLIEKAYSLDADEYGEAINRSDFEKRLRVIKNDPDKDKYIRWMENVPSARIVGMSDAEVAAEWTANATVKRDALLKRIQASVDNGTLTQAQADNRINEINQSFARLDEDIQARIIKMREADSALAPSEKEAAEIYRRGLRQVMMAGDKHGARAADRVVPTEFADALNPQQMEMHFIGARTDLLRAPTFATGLSFSDVAPNGRYGRGIAFTNNADDAAQEVGVGLYNPVMIRPNNALSNSDKWDEWWDETRKAVEAGKPTYLASDPYLVESNWEKFVEAKTNELVTQKAINAGHDGVVIYGEDGNTIVGGTAFVDPETLAIPVKRLDESANTILEDRGYFPHMISESLHRARRGERTAGEFHPGELVHEQGRVTDEDFFTLDEKLRKEHHDLPSRAMIDDPIKVYELYAKRFATGAAKAQLGSAGRSLLDTFGGGASQAVTFLNRYSPEKGFLGPANMARLSDKARESYVKVQERQVRETSALEREAIDLAEQKARLEAELVLREGRGQLAVGSRRAVGASRKEMQTLQKQIDQVTAVRKRLGNSVADQKKAGELDSQLDVLIAKRRELAAGQMPLDTPERMSAAQAELARRLDKRVDALAKRQTKKEAQIRRLSRQTEGALNEMNKIRTRLETHAAVPTPAIITDGSRAGYVSMGAIKGLEGIHMHPYVAAEFTNALKGTDLSTMRKAWREWVTGPWKSWATVYFPGFHARNNLGAWFNNWLGGVTAKDYVYSHRLSSALHEKSKWFGVKVDTKTLDEWGLAHEVGLTWDELAERVHASGIRGTNSIGFADTGRNLRELRRLQDGKPQSSVGRVATKVGDVIPAGKWARAATEVTENFHRQAAYIAGLRNTGGDFAGARMFTMMRHGDYEDLNDFEQGVKDLVPFYKWMRTNLPFQMHMLTEAPGKQLAVGKLATNIYVMQGVDPDQARKGQPSWVQESFTIPIPGGVKSDDAMMLLSLDLPMADLYQGANDYLASFLPMVRPLVESYVLEQNIFTGAPLRGEKKPLAGWAKLPGIRQAIAPFVEKDAQGNEVMDDRTQNFLSAIPVFSRFRNWVFSDPKSQENRAAALFSSILGVRPRAQGPEDLTAAELGFYYDEILPVVTNLKNLGVKLPEPGDISPEVYEYLGFTPPASEEAGGLPNPNEGS